MLQRASSARATRICCTLRRHEPRCPRLCRALIEEACDLHRNRARATRSSFEKPVLYRSPCAEPVDAGVLAKASIFAVDHRLNSAGEICSSVSHSKRRTPKSRRIDSSTTPCLSSN